MTDKNGKNNKNCNQNTYTEDELHELVMKCLSQIVGDVGKGMESGINATAAAYAICGEIGHDPVDELFRDTSIQVVSCNDTPVDFRVELSCSSKATLVLTRHTVEFRSHFASSSNSDAIIVTTAKVEDTPLGELTDRIWCRITGDGPRDKAGDDEYIILD